MGKKTTIQTKAAAPAKIAAKPAVKVLAKGKPTTASPAKPKPKAVSAKVPGFTRDDVALRAYYIAEKRRHLGLPGSDSGDWVEAERQLVAESKPLKKGPRAKPAAK